MGSLTSAFLTSSFCAISPQYLLSGQCCILFNQNRIPKDRILFLLHLYPGVNDGSLESLMNLVALSLPWHPQEISSTFCFSLRICLPGHGKEREGKDHFLLLSIGDTLVHSLPSYRKTGKYGPLINSHIPSKKI